MSSELRAQLSPHENVQASLDVDLSTDLRFGAGLVALTEGRLLAHAPGSTIDLWYDPAHPADSSPLLDRTGRGGAVLTTAMGAAFIVFGAAVMLHLI